MPIGFDDLVHDVMNGWPATIRVFLDFRMGCVGCLIARFHTVDDACREHHVDRDAFLKALREAAGRPDDTAAARVEMGRSTPASAGPGVKGWRD